MEEPKWSYFNGLSRDDFLKEVSKEDGPDDITGFAGGLNRDHNLFYLFKRHGHSSPKKWRAVIGDKWREDQANNIRKLMEAGHQYVFFGWNNNDAPWYICDEEAAEALENALRSGTMAP